MRIAFAGTPAAAVPSLRRLLDSDHDVVAVLTRPDARAGRGRGLRPSPVREVADQAGVPVLTPSSARDEGLAASLRALELDACPVVAYGMLLPQDILQIPRHGWVNLHFSLLPAWRGAAPVQHAVMAGDEVTGATTFLLDEGMDTGPVLGTMTEAIRPDDTAGALLDRLATGGAELLAASLDAIADGSVVARAQPPEGISYAPKLSTADARIDLSRPALAVSRLIAGCTPSPGAWTTWRGQRVKLGPVELWDRGGQVSPGGIKVTGDGVVVGTGTVPVRLGEIQPPGKSMMAARDWARGARLEAQEVFGE